MLNAFFREEQEEPNIDVNEVMNKFFQDPNRTAAIQITGTEVSKL